MEAPSPEQARSVATSVANAFVGIVQSSSRERNARLQAELQRSIAKIAAETERLQSASAGEGRPGEGTPRVASRRPRGID